jgi:hypothetical protein
MGSTISGPPQTQLGPDVITPKRDKNDMIEPIDRHEPIESSEPADAIEPTDSTEPTEPIDKTEPLQPIERTEFSDHSDHRLVSRSAGIEHDVKATVPKET